MPRKIYDIKPPKTVRKIERTKPVSPKEPLVKVKEKARIAIPASIISPEKKEKKVMWAGFPIIILAAVIIIGGYLFFKLPKADVTIWPKVNTLSFQQTIIADKSVTSVDSTKNVIPAEYFQVTKTNAQDFPATGSASNIGEAQGTITIYNKFDPPKSFNFIAGTHFMSDSGKLFIALQKVTIPAAKKSGSKITPGSVQVNVQAVEGGPDYNIAPSNFSVPGLKGTASYYSIYATSTSAMTGGYTGNVKKVTDDDIQGAKDTLTQKSTTDAMTALKSQITSDYVLLDNASLANVTDASTQTKSGAVADNFHYSVTVQASALVFKKSDLDQFVNNYITLQAPAGSNLLDGSTKVNYSSSLIDISGGKATLNLNLSAGVYQNIDKNSVGLSLLGESQTQARETIDNNLGDQISKVEIKLWPFWVSAVPNNQSAVKVNLKF